MSQDTNVARALESDQFYRKKIIKTLTLPLLGMAAPFAPTSLALGIGVAIGVVAVRHLSQLSSEASKPRRAKEPVQAEQAGADLEDAQVRDKMLLAYVEDLAVYQHEFDDYLIKEKVTRANNQVYRRFAFDYFPRMRPFMQPDSMSVRHTAVVGSTGVGKTEYALNALKESIARGGGGLIYNPKGDMELINKVNYIATLYHREDDIRFINLDRPDLSHTYNLLLGGGNVRETVSTVMKVNSNTREEFFRDQNRAALIAAIACLQAQPDNLAFNFGDLGVLFNDPYLFHQLFDRIPDTESETRAFVWQFLKSWITRNRDDEVVYNIDQYQKILKGLASKMFDFAHTEYAKVLCDYTPDIELREAILSNKIIVISLPALADKEGTELFGKLFMADLARAAGQMHARGERPLIPFPVILDEYGSIKDASHQELFQLVRSVNIALSLMVQAKGFLDDEDPTFAANLLGNCWTHIYLFQRDPDTIEYAAKLAGETIRRFTQSSSGESFGFGHQNATTGGLRAENTGVSVSTGYKETREAQLLFQDFMQLNEGDALIITKEGTFRARMPRLNFVVEPPELNELPLPYFTKPRVKGLNLMQRALAHDKNVINSLGESARHGGGIRL